MIYVIVVQIENLKSVTEKVIGTLEESSERLLFQILRT